MLVNGKQTRAIFWNENENSVQIIDQRLLPFEYKIITLNTVKEVYDAIADMAVRGAPVIGASAAFGMYLAFLESKNTDQFLSQLKEKADYLKSSRPTAVNLMFAVDWMMQRIQPDSTAQDVLTWAIEYAEKDVEDCHNIGKVGVQLIEEIYYNKKDTVNILTHCNAGWLATGEYGTATAPIYLAHDAGIPVHVWVDETRPRNQGANLTAWELKQHGVPFTVIADNTGGHLMQHQQVDLCIVGSDRTSLNGDVANKIGTYLKALAAYDNQVPFYVALPATTIDFDLEDGVKNIPIEKRSTEEMSHVSGLNDKGNVQTIRMYLEGVEMLNYAFDVTPAKYVTGLITEQGLIKATKEAIQQLKR